MHGSVRRKLRQVVTLHSCTMVTPKTRYPIKAPRYWTSLLAHVVWPNVKFRTDNRPDASSRSRAS